MADTDAEPAARRTASHRQLSVTADEVPPPASLIGQPLERLEDAALLTGQGRYADDLGAAPGTLHAAFVRTPHAHADILRIDAAAALAMPGVHGVLTGDDVRNWSKPFVVGVKQPMEHWCLAVDRARYVGEPVAVLLAEDRYLAEDAAERVVVDYRPLPAVVDPERAALADAPVLHDAVGANVVSDRAFVYGDPDAAFAAAAHRVALTLRYPRNAASPMECFVVLADYHAAEGVYDVLSNFQGPYPLHPVMALALQVPGNRLRLRTPPDSGGSFGAKQAIFPYIVALSLASRKAGRPVKWVEDRLEHLTAATSAVGRITEIEAAVTADGEVTALRLDQMDDCGGYLRAPEPASLYRMHGNLTGAYKIRNLAVRNRVVLTNKTPTGLTRGFGGPQLYFALERLMHTVAVTLALDPLDVIRRNLIPADAFPYRAPAGSLLDSGDYQTGIATAAGKGGLAALKSTRDAARAEGRLYGIGYACVVEPTVSNMGYITTVLTPEERERAGPKNGAQAVATVAIDPLGSVTVNAASTPQGQGHRTVLAQVVADALGLRPADLVITVDMDTAKDGWSIASGNYASRFAGSVAGAAHLAAMRLRDKLALIAAPQLNVPASAVRFTDGRIYADGNPDNWLPFHRLAASGHWSPGSLPEGADPALRETAIFTPPQLTPPTVKDEINNSAAYSFVFDFCGVEIDRDTGRLRIDKYVSLHDAGRILNRAMVDGQARGSFAFGLGAALYEELAYSADGAFLSGSFADYLLPTAMEVPDLHLLHMETPSPFTPLGAKGAGDGNTLSTPVCLANAVADALDVRDVALPLTPSRLLDLIGEAEPPPKAASKPAPAVAGRALTGAGGYDVPASAEAVWRTILDPAALAHLLPGCDALELVGEHAYRAEMTVGVGPVKGVFTAEVALSALDPPRSLTLTGSGAGPLGTARGQGSIEIEEIPGGARVSYRYEAEIAGKVAAVGGRMLDGAARFIIAEFFQRLTADAAGGVAPARRSLWRRLLRFLGLGP